VQGGVIMVGDTVIANDHVLGVVAGFDEAHMPNHHNIVIQTIERRSGFELGLKVGDRLVMSSNGLDPDGLPAEPRFEEAPAEPRQEVARGLTRK
jgi:hypothetical protein